MRNDCLRKQHWRAHVDIHHGLVFLHIDLGDRSGVADCCAVDENIETTECCDGFAHGARDRRRARCDSGRDCSAVSRLIASVLDERQQVGVDEIGMRGKQSVRQARIGLQRSVRQQLDRRASRRIDRYHLIVLAMHQ